MGSWCCCENVLKKVQKCWTGRGVRNSTVNEVRERGRERCSRLQSISMEHMERTMVEHGGPLQLMEQILIHTAACGRPLSGASGCFLKDMWPVEKELERRIVTLATIPNLSYAIWGWGKIEVESEVGSGKR